MKTTCTQKQAEHRQRIINAMKEQAISKGFHKASMSEIAKSAELSVGQIYRYFAHKDDIICALVEQTTLCRLELMPEFLNKQNWLDRHITPPNQARRNIRILTIEIKAEAARNSVISEICRKSHTLLRNRAVEIMQERYPMMDKQEIIARIDLLITITEGFVSRWDDQRQSYSAATISLYHKILDDILPD
ncbi:TetR/AcrR family transcriptional regulator [Marinomonas pollencensis]|uniref:TetR family transcriptional regulator n=1 Tax=Marinomonas pollencensis TaxID=491954 RepID=A0A3E0DRH1_9GAMM|nr:TetR/AcrR family transcriptional regulator [Marinomonas pollencensis]REG84925.1 TetR family transcriptional regulator [Marinomonas pollencensis]